MKRREKKNAKITKRASRTVAVFVFVLWFLQHSQFMHNSYDDRWAMRVGWAKLPSIMKWRQLLYNVIYTDLPSHAIIIIIIHRVIQSVWFSRFLSSFKIRRPVRSPMIEWTNEWRNGMEKIFIIFNITHNRECIGIQHRDEVGWYYSLLMWCMRYDWFQIYQKRWYVMYVRNERIEGNVKGASMDFLSFRIRPVGHKVLSLNTVFECDQHGTWVQHMELDMKNSPGRIKCSIHFFIHITVANEK